MALLCSLCFYKILVIAMYMYVPVIIVAKYTFCQQTCGATVLEPPQKHALHFIIFSYYKATFPLIHIFLVVPVIVMTCIINASSVSVIL